VDKHPSNNAKQVIAKAAMRAKNTQTKLQMNKNSSNHDEYSLYLKKLYARA